MSSFQGHWGFPTSIEVGENALKTLPNLVETLKVKRPLIVTDKGLAQHNMIVNAKKGLDEQGYFAQIFSEIHQNPVIEDVSLGVKAFNEFEHDAIITIGGGSAMDVGKAIALMSAQELPIQAFIDEGDRWKQAKTPICPIIAIPTTAGTGSEVGRCAVILDEKTEQKLIIFHPDLLPKKVILDPLTTLSLPKELTAYTGMDALSHNLEALCVDSYHPLADAIAQKGIQLVHENLLTAYQTPDNIEARTHMLVASTMGATAFQKGLGGMHALSHALGGLYGAHHGMLNAILMPYVLQYNEKAIEGKLTSLCIMMQLPTPSFKTFMDWCLDLRKALKIPHCLNELEITFDFDKILPLALKDPSRAGNPVPIDSQGMEKIFQSALMGTL